jgi:hypothetical protein
MPLKRGEITIIQVYRAKPGDLDIPDVPAFGFEQSENVAASRLESYFRDPTRHDRQKPTQARVLGEDGQVKMEFRMEPKGSKRIR